MKQEQLTKITKALKDNTKGMTVTEIAKEINLNRNSVAKYLEVLLISGHLEMRSYGPAKVFFLSQRVPMSALIDFSSDYIIILDRDLKIMQVNDNFLKLANIESKTILGQKLESTALPAFNSAEMKSNLRAVLNGKRVNKELTCTIGKKQYFCILKMIPTTFEDGLPGVTLILEDITERKQVEEELRKSEQRYRRLLESISDGVYVVDNESRIVLVNQAGSQLVQTNKTELLGKKAIDVFQSIKNTPFFNAFEQVMKTGKPDTVVSDYVNKNKIKATYEARMYPVPEGVLIMVRKVTEQNKN